MNKRKRKEYDKSNKVLSFKANFKEQILLKQMMQEEGWSNLSAFIKDKLFGESSDMKYEKLLSKPKKEDLPIIMTVLLEELNRKLDYINYRFDDEVEEFKRQTKELDKKSAARWFSFLFDWKKEIGVYGDELMTACSKILHSMDIDFKKTKFSKNETIPKHVLERASKNWNDTLSDEAMLASKMMGEQFQKEFAEKIERARKEINNIKTNE